MARASKASHDEQQRSYSTTKIDTSLLPMARVIAAVDETTIADLFSELLRDPLQARYQKALKALNRNGSAWKEETPRK
jgi:hypothetical protein